MIRTGSRLALVASMLVFAWLALPALQAADRFVGTLMPVKCQYDDPEEHTTACALKCAETGLGLATEDGRFLKFDEAGDTKALAWLKATTRENALEVIVTGTLQDGVLRVDAIADPE